MIQLIKKGQVGATFKGALLQKIYFGMADSICKTHNNNILFSVIPRLTQKCSFHFVCEYKQRNVSTCLLCMEILQTINDSREG